MALKKEGFLERQLERLNWWLQVAALELPVLLTKNAISIHQNSG